MKPTEGAWEKRYWELRDNRRMANYPIDQEDVMEAAIEDLKEALELDRKENANEIPL